MGAWGYRSFENDSALDWLNDLIEGQPSLLGETLDRVADTSHADYLEADDCSVALAAAEVVAAALDRGMDRLCREAAAWLESHQESARKVGAERARRAVQRVLEGSELLELWDEAGVECGWHADVRELLNRLAP